MEKENQCKVKLDQAQKILDEDHYGLKTVKERITEYLAVQKRTKKLKGPNPFSCWTTWCWKNFLGS
ncbi:MAG: hypothetical protein Ct9H300mP6_11160 [Gammaproteobacteria bacterium]|nr:MAG: hypothetical protein Ct9H300mP6_11160 [Gammaproteobacteria bacterium]